MAKNDGYFKFKEFEITQKDVPFRFGTDSLLIGSWAGKKNPKTILDVGTGCGILALMMAQRNKEALVYALDISKEACEIAQENFKKSSFKDRMKVIHTNWDQYAPEFKFDLIISNPPYFKNQLLGNDAARNNARHQENFSYEKWIQQSSQMLNAEGRCSFIFPTDQESEIFKILEFNHLFVVGMCRVHSSEKTESIRTMLSFSRRHLEYEPEALSIYTPSKTYSKEYIKLTNAFYLSS